MIGKVPGTEKALKDVSEAVMTTEIPKKSWRHYELLKSEGVPWANGTLIILSRGPK